METFYRWNIEGSSEFPIHYTEKELRAIIGASVRNVESTISKLKRGYAIWTKYGVYSCSPEKPTR